MFGDWKLDEFQLWQEVWPQAGSILGVDLTFSLEAINHSFIHPFTQIFQLLSPFCQAVYTPC